MTRIGTIGVCAVIDCDEPLAYYVSLALLRPNNNVINSKFLKYTIESSYGRKELRKRTLINAVPIKVNMGDIGKITIPVPPLEVQNEIVRILDNFTELTAELNAELTARQKQYEYYRDKLLDFTVPPRGHVVSFGGHFANLRKSVRAVITLMKNLKSAIIRFLSVRKR